MTRKLFGTITIYRHEPEGYSAEVALRHDQALSTVRETPQDAIAEVVNAVTINPDLHLAREATLDERAARSAAFRAAMTKLRDAQMDEADRQQREAWGRPK